MAGPESEELKQVCEHLIQMCEHLIQVCEHLIQMCEHLIQMCEHLIQMCWAQLSLQQSAGFNSIWHEVLTPCRYFDPPELQVC